MSASFKVSRQAWTSKFAIVSYVTASFCGIYARDRAEFTNDFSYNKYHFGVLIHLLSAAGIHNSIKYGAISW
jgi:hypothetical protein